MKYMELKITGMMRILGLAAIIAIALGVTNCSDDEEPCIEATAASAGPDQSSCGSSVVLGANQPSSNETGVWEIVSGANGQFDDASKFNASFSGDAGATYTLKWTLSTNCDSKSDEVVISLGGDLVSLAGNDQTVCGTSTILAGNNVTGATGEWTILSGTGGVLDDASSFNSGFSGEANQSYTLAWKVTAGECSVEDQVTITLNVPVANAGEDQVVLGTATVLAASDNGAGSWSIVSGDGGSFGDMTVPTSTFRGNPATTYVLRWTSLSNGCSSSDDVQVTFKRLKYFWNYYADKMYSQFIYDAAGRLIQISPQNGSNSLTVDFAYDENGLLTTRTGTNSNADPALAWTETYKYFYDASNRLETMERWFENSGGANLQETYHYVYDQDGLLTSIDKELPSGAQFAGPITYDAQGLITEYSLFSKHSSIVWLDESVPKDPNPERYVDISDPTSGSTNLLSSWVGPWYTTQNEYEYDNDGLVTRWTERQYEDNGGTLTLVSSFVCDYIYE